MERRHVDLVVAGDVNPDVIVVDADPTPVFGQVERIVREVRITMGGSSSIMACGAARLGLDVSFCGVVGDDDAGRLALGLLRDRGVDVAACRVDRSAPTAVTVVLARHDDRAILTSLGTIGALTTDDIPADLVARARHLHVGSTALQPHLRAGLPGLFRHARASGTTTSFDANWDPDERWDDLDGLLATADVCFPNLAEGRRWTGRTEQAEVARAVVARADTAGRDAGARPASGPMSGRAPGGGHDRRRGFLRRRVRDRDAPGLVAGANALVRGGLRLGVHAGHRGRGWAADHGRGADAGVTWPGRSRTA